MSDRVIKSRARNGAAQLADCLATLLALELARPGGRLYLISPRLGDMLLLDSRFGQFRALMPEMSRTELRLGETLNILAARGADVRVLYRAGSPQSEAFLSHLAPGVKTRAVAQLDERGLIGERFYLRGSLEFTLEGVAIGAESAELTTEPAAVARALLETEQLWRYD